MEIKKGIGVSPGVVISTAIVLDAADLLIPKRQVDVGQIPCEVERFDRAVNDSVADLAKLKESVAQRAGKEVAGIFDFHIGVLNDKSVLKQIGDEIRKNQ